MGDYSDDYSLNLALKYNFPNFDKIILNDTFTENNSQPHR